MEPKRFSNLTLQTFAQSKSDFMVWCIFNAKFWSVLFEGHDGNTLYSGRYVNMLNGFFFPLLNDLGINTISVYFQFMENGQIMSTVLKNIDKHHTKLGRLQLL